MKVHLVGQPYAEDENVRERLVTALRDRRHDRLDMAVAWAKRSGLRLVEEELRAFRANGGVVRAVVGVSQGGATRQGLELVMDLSDESFVFHQSDRTFHPKVYVVRGRGSGLVVIGSSNLTRGGLVENWEASVAFELDLAEDDDRALLDQVLGYVDGLVHDEQACRPLDHDFLAALLTDPSVAVGDEDRENGPGDARRTTGDGTGLFGRTTRKLGRAGGRRPAPGTGKSRTGERGRPVAGDGEVVARWSKKLATSDAQRLGGNSNPTGAVTLVQSRHPINQATWFREVLFGDADWQTAARTRLGAEQEEAHVDFAVHVDGRFDARHTLRISYTPKFGSNQRNRTSQLHWGTLTAKTREEDLTGRYLTIEKRIGGEFVLIIGPEPSGPFVEP